MKQTLFVLTAVLWIFGGIWLENSSTVVEPAWFAFYGALGAYALMAVMHGWKRT